MDSVKTTTSQLRQHRRVLAMLMAAAIAVLCAVWIEFSTRSNAGDGPTSHIVRATRRQYVGAPPVVPHPPLSGDCVTCHTPEGSHKPPLGFAPANPHSSTPGMSQDARCRQCHVFRMTDTLFVESELVPSALTRTTGARAYATAPPVIPHSLMMRDNCLACHAGPAARPEIRCSHPERTRCVQCHMKHTHAPEFETLDDDFNGAQR